MPNARLLLTLIVLLLVDFSQCAVYFDSSLKTDINVQVPSQNTHPINKVHFDSEFALLEAQVIDSITYVNEAKALRCQSVPLPYPGLSLGLSNVSQNDTHTTATATLTGDCSLGMVLSATSAEIACTTEQGWVGLPVCQYVHCPRPADPENGLLVCASLESTLEYGTVCNVTCSLGFAVEKSITCQANKQFSSVPLCQYPSSCHAQYQIDPSSSDGVYTLSKKDGSQTYQAACMFDAEGGWTRIFAVDSAFPFTSTTQFWDSGSTYGSTDLAAGSDIGQAFYNLLFTRTKLFVKGVEVGTLAADPVFSTNTMADDLKSLCATSTDTSHFLIKDTTGDTYYLFTRKYAQTLSNHYPCMVYFQMGATQSDALAGGYGQLQIGQIPLSGNAAVRTGGTVWSDFFTTQSSNPWSMAAWVQ